MVKPAYEAFLQICDDDDDDDDDDDEMILRDGWPKNIQQPYFQKRPSSGSLYIMTTYQLAVDGMDRSPLKQQSLMLLLQYFKVTKANSWL